MTKKTNFPLLKYMDGEYLFRYYFQTMGEARSFPKLIEHCRAEYVIHPESGSPPTKMGLYKAMWRWATRKQNQRIAFDIYQNSELGEEYEYFETWEDWLDFLKDRIASAHQFAKPNEYRNFLRDNGYNS